MTHVAKIAVEGNVVYIGREPTREGARAAERAARTEYARTGQVERARSVYRRPSSSFDDAQDWFEANFGGQRPPLRGEQRLMVGVLQAAIHELNSRSARERSAAVRWFSGNDRSYLYSFATICDEFEIPIEAARRDVLADRVEGREHGLVRTFKLRKGARAVLLALALVGGSFAHSGRPATAIEAR